MAFLLISFHSEAIDILRVKLKHLFSTKFLLMSGFSPACNKFLKYKHSLCCNVSKKILFLIVLYISYMLSCMICS